MHGLTRDILCHRLGTTIFVSAELTAENWHLQSSKLVDLVTNRDLPLGVSDDFGIVAPSRFTDIVVPISSFMASVLTEDRMIAAARSS